MPTPGDAVAQRTLIYLLAGGAVMTYVASKAAVDAVVGKVPSTSGWIATGHWVTLAVVTLVAMAMGQPNVAVALLFASSVVCLTLGVGSLAVVGGPVAAGARRSASGMLLPIVLAAFLAGFQGRLTLMHAGVLFMLGLTADLLWRGPDWEDKPKLAMARRGHLGVRLFQLLLAAALAAVGGWAAVKGISGVHPSNGVATPGLLSVTLLAPLLVLPALGAGIDLAQRNRSAVACDAFINIVVLNLCVLLPACIVESNFHVLQRTVTAVFPAHGDAPATEPPGSPPGTEPATSPASQPTALGGPPLASSRPSTAPAAAPDDATAAPVGLVIPRSSWRIDAIALVVLALLLLPVTLGRWPLTRGDGFGLILAYLAYVLMAVVQQVRS